MTEKQIGFSCITWEPWGRVIESLMRTGEIEISFLIVWRNEQDIFRTSFPEIKLLIVEDLWMMKVDKNLLLNQKRERIPLKHKLIALQMIERQCFDNCDFNLTLKNEFFERMVDYWNNLLAKTDLIVSPSIPHRFFDYALFVSCDINHIKFITFQMLPFGSRIIPLLDNIDEMPKLGSPCPNSELRQLAAKKISHARKDYKYAEPAYMAKHRKNRKLRLIIKNSLLKLRRNLTLDTLYKFRRPNTYIILGNVLPWYQKAGWMAIFLLFCKKILKSKRLAKECTESSVKKTVEGERYFLFALHYQPEETSCPSASVFADQLMTIRWIAGQLPDNHILYVKEHGAQHDFHQEGSQGRSRGFYQAVSEIGPRVKLIDSKANTFDLIDQSEGVMTLTGTIGWEAIQRGKPSLVFGRSWYETHPMCLRVSEHDREIDFEAFLSKDVCSDRENLNWHEWLLANSIHAKHYKGWISNTDITIEQSARNLSDFLLGEVLG
jgi:hypothetical protein